jgi:hypothetical protein
MEKMVSLFTKVLYMGTITLVAHTDASLPLVANWLYIVYFHLVHHGLQMPPPQVKMKWG